MKYLVLFIIAILMVGCSPFPTEFSNIRSSDLRVLDFIYEPAEAAPGDTVHVKAIFGGKAIRPTDIDWKISFDVVKNLYGTIDTALNIMPLNSVPVEESFSNNTTCMKFSFVIPPNIMYTSSSIPENWTSLIPQNLLDTIPEVYKRVSKTDMLSLVENLSKIDPPFLAGVIAADTNLSKSIPVLCQLLSVKIRLFAKIQNSLRVESNYSVRYNSKLKETGVVYVNNNPKIDSIGIYKVPGTKTKYNPAEKNHEFIRLDVPKAQEKTVVIDKDFSYFVNVFASNPDTIQTIDGIITGETRPEQFFTTWFYQLDSSEVKDLSLNDFMHIKGDTLMATITPPTKESIKTFTIWSQVYDDNGYSNVINRPQGSSLIEVHGRFEYTKAYLDNVKKK